MTFWSLMFGNFKPAGWGVTLTPGTLQSRPKRHYKSTDCRRLLPTTTTSVEWLKLWNRWEFVPFPPQFFIFSPSIFYHPVSYTQACRDALLGRRWGPPWTNQRFITWLTYRERKALFPPTDNLESWSVAEAPWENQKKSKAEHCKTWKKRFSQHHGATIKLQKFFSYYSVKFLNTPRETDSFPANTTLFSLAFLRRSGELKAANPVLEGVQCPRLGASLTGGLVAPPAGAPRCPWGY